MLVLEHAIIGNGADFPLINRSFNLSTADTICDGQVEDSASDRLRRRCDEPAPTSDESLRVSDGLQARIRDIMGRALCIRHVDSGSCNGCELEIHALNNSVYNIEGLRIMNSTYFGLLAEFGEPIFR